MPELPEVETIKLGLESKIVGLKIKELEVLNPKSFQGDASLARGTTVLKVWRRAKVLGINLDCRQTLLIHLKMSGQLIFQGMDKLVGGHPTKDMLGEMPNKSTRVIFHFFDGSTLFFNDQRKFGWIKLFPTQEIEKNPGLIMKNVGPEPLGEDFTWQTLKLNLLRHKKTPVKVAILDQTVVAGVGNIYACEACFSSKIHPTKRIETLTDKDFQKLHQGIIQSLNKGIEMGGSTRTHFVNPEGKKGYFLDYAFVYSREGLECKVCQTKIEKIRLAGRGTEYCPTCQTL